MRVLRGVGSLALLLSMLGCATREQQSREQRSEDAFQRGTAAMDRKDWDAAVKEFTEAIRLDPQDDSAYHNRGFAYAEKREYAKAIADYKEAVRLAPDDPTGHTSLAWLLATCPDAGLRDGKRAVKLATRACELSDWEDANDLENLAAAHAECGRFDEAVRWQAKAVALGTGLLNAGEARDRLDLYKKGKPFRE
jgi:tetratricopeptide (TPR) repeat protein